MVSDKKFGLFLSAIFALLAIIFFVNHKIFYLFLFLFILCMSITFLKPTYLNRLKILWYQLGILIGKIINPIVLGFIFFILFVPIALFMKIIRRDHLRINFKKIDSFWINRENKNLNKTTFYNQY